MTGPLATVLIPAWNEGAVIARTLASLTGPDAGADFHLIVIPNNCSDDTAAQARAAAPAARVIETPVGGKTHAMNLGYEAADKALPVICLDADLSVTPDDLRALIAPLQAGRALAACGRMDLDLTGATWAARGFYRIWALNPYFAQGKFGGLFALAPAGAARVFPLPKVTADDEFIRRAFASDEVAFVPECAFTARPPRDLPSLIRVRRRVLRGARQLAAMGLAAPEGQGGTLKALLRRALPRPLLWPSLAVYLGVAVTARALLALEPAGAAPTWEKDLTSRNAKV